MGGCATKLKGVKADAGDLPAPEPAPPAKEEAGVVSETKKEVVEVVEEEKKVVVQEGEVKEREVIRTGRFMTMTRLTTKAPSADLSVSCSRR